MTAESTKLFITSVYKTIGKEYLSMSIEDRMREGKELLEQVCAEIKIPTTPRGEILIDEKGVGIFKVPKTQPSQAMGYFEQIKTRTTEHQRTTEQPPTNLYELINHAEKYRTLPQTCRILGRDVNAETYVRELLTDMDDNGNFRKRKLLDEKDVAYARKVLSNAL